LLFHPWFFLAFAASLPGLFYLGYKFFPLIGSIALEVLFASALSSHTPPKDFTLALSLQPMSLCGFAFQPMQFPTILPSGFILSVSLRFLFFL
jgi:hypothetical protein